MGRCESADAGLAIIVSIHHLLQVISKQQIDKLAAGIEHGSIFILDDNNTINDDLQSAIEDFEGSDNCSDSLLRMLQTHADNKTEIALDFACIVSNERWGHNRTNVNASSEEYYSLADMESRLTQKASEFWKLTDFKVHFVIKQSSC